jgi:hypothetical protein
VNLGVSRVPQRVESTGPRRDPSGECQDDERRKTDQEGGHDKRLQEQLELLAGDQLSDDLDKGDQLQQTKDTKSGHVLRGTDREEFDERDLHRRDRADDVPGRVRDVQSVCVSSHQDEDKGVEWDHCGLAVIDTFWAWRRTVGDEDVSSPSGHHPTIEQRGHHSPERTALLHCLDPEVERGHEEEDGNRFVVIRSCDRSRDVSRDDADESRGEQTRAWCGHLGGEPGLSGATCKPLSAVHSQVSRDGGQTGESGGEHDADVSNVDRHVDQPQEAPDEAGGDHETRVDRTPDGPAEGVPSCRIEPVPEFLSVSGRSLTLFLEGVLDKDR